MVYHTEQIYLTGTGSGLGKYLAKKNSKFLHLSTTDIKTGITSINTSDLLIHCGFHRIDPSSPVDINDLYLNYEINFKLLKNFHKII